MPEIPPSLADVRLGRAAPAGHGDPHGHDDRARDRPRRLAVRRRGDPGAHGGVDRGRQAASRGGASSACRSTTAAASPPTASARSSATPGVWAIGDAAAVPDPAHRDRPSPPTAQHVLRQGKVVGDNVAAVAERRAAACGRSATARSACSSTWAARRPWRARWASAGAASRPGSSPAPTTSPSCPAAAAARASSSDWTVGLLFGRDSAELGQLGHPPPLALGERSGGGTTPGDAPPEA